MEFKLEHTFDCDLKTFEKALDHPELDGYLERNVTAFKRRELLERVENNGSVFTRVRCVPQYEIPERARAFIDPERLEWVEESDRDKKNHEIDYKLIPGMFRRQIATYGKFKLSEAEDGQKTVREIIGNVVVRFPGMSEKIERYISSKIIRVLEEEAKVLANFIREYSSELK